MCLTAISPYKIDNKKKPDGTEIDDSEDVIEDFIVGAKFHVRTETELLERSNLIKDLIKL